MVTARGTTFAGRVGASLLSAIGLPELIADALDSYEALALRPARDPEMLASVKAKLMRNRATQPLFDTKRFTQNLEAAYLAMWQRQQNGDPLAPIAVDDAAGASPR
jgi:protein O-GlcNAc transferase